MKIAKSIEYTSSGLAARPRVRRWSAITP